MNPRNDDNLSVDKDLLSSPKRSRPASVSDTLAAWYGKLDTTIAALRAENEVTNAEKIQALETQKKALTNIENNTDFFKHISAIEECVARSEILAENAWLSTFERLLINALTEKGHALLGTLMDDFLPIIYMHPEKFTREVSGPLNMAIRTFVKNAGELSAELAKDARVKENEIENYSTKLSDTVAACNSFLTQIKPFEQLPEIFTDADHRIFRHNIATELPVKTILKTWPELLDRKIKKASEDDTRREEVSELMTQKTRFQKIGEDSKLFDYIADIQEFVSTANHALKQFSPNEEDRARMTDLISNGGALVQVLLNTVSNLVHTDISTLSPDYVQSVRDSVAIQMAELQRSAKAISDETERQNNEIRAYNRNMMRRVGSTLSFLRAFSAFEPKPLLTIPDASGQIMLDKAGMFFSELDKYYKAHRPAKEEKVGGNNDHSVKSGSALHHSGLFSLHSPAPLAPVQNNIRISNIVCNNTPSEIMTVIQQHLGKNAVLLDTFHKVDNEENSNPTGKVRILVTQYFNERPAMKPASAASPAPVIPPPVTIVAVEDTHSHKYFGDKNQIASLSPEHCWKIAKTQIDIFLKSHPFPRKVVLSNTDPSAKGIITMMALYYEQCKGTGAEFELKWGRNVQPPTAEDVEKANNALALPEEAKENHFRPLSM